MENHITIKSLSFSYSGGASALRSISLAVGKGEFVTVCGLSGSGKSTLLRLLKPGLQPWGAMTGEILFNGRPLPQEPDAAASAAIGFVMQDTEAQVVTDRVWHELAFSCESVGLPPQEIRRRVGEAACYFGLEELFERSTAELSGGQRQLLCLASAAALHPEILLLDEPSSQLDPVSAQSFVDTVHRLNRDFGITVIAAEHRLEELLPVSGRVVVMDSGEIIADCPPEELVSALPPNHKMRHAMTAAQRVYAAAGGTGRSPVSVCEGRANELCREYLRTHKEPERSPRRSRQSEKPLVEVHNLCAGWGKSAPFVLRGVNLRVYSGEIYAVVGGNGCGKSTLLQAIYGIVKPFSGKLKLQKGIAPAYLPQNPCMLFTKASVSEEISENAAEEFGLTALCGRDPLDLSGGERQRLALAMLLSEPSELLLLDEPAKGTDAAFRAELAERLRAAAAKGTAVILVTHDTELAAECADVCGMLFNGEIISEAPPAEMFGQNYYYTTPMSRLLRG